MDQVSKENKMIKKKLNLLRKSFKKYRIDGYIIPKNDEFFSEYSNQDRLKIISNFDGSAGFAIILKNKNYLFVDGRYSIQAKIQSGRNFKVLNYNKILNCDLFKDKILGFDPRLFTRKQINNFFLKYNKAKKIEENLIDKLYKKKLRTGKSFYSLPETAVGESFKNKINKIIQFLQKNKADYLFVTASENVAWLLNIRGQDNPTSPIPNCHLLIDASKNIYIITERKKVQKLIREKKINLNEVIEPKNFSNFLKKLKKNKIIVDEKTCSIFFEDIIKQKFKIIKKDDPIYLLKSIKNKIEIQNMIQSHIYDGVALTKFIYWMKKINKKEISEFEATKKLEKFRKSNKNYLYPSFNTIAGSGGNGAIVHYRATKGNSKKIKRNEIFLCDSGGQYKYGTTDVTRTICFKKPNNKIKDVFTKVLKGHIAVVTANLKKNYCGNLLDKKARNFLKKDNLDYEHGTGHGVGFFLNVHEGPQSISKNNYIKLREGMILSNEPGYYKKNSFGIRIENLIYVKKRNKELFFENLTFAPIDKDLIDFKQLNKNEKKYLFKYNMEIYSKLSKYLSVNEKKWLVSLI